MFSFLDKINDNFSAFNSKKVTINVIDTGSPAVNNVIGINGLPRGRVTQIWGPMGSGKSFFSMVAAKNALDADLDSVVVWFDVENSFCYDWAEKMGIWTRDPATNRMLILKTTDGVDIFEALYGKIKKDKFGAKKVAEGILDNIISGSLNCPLIVIDSIASIITPKEKASPVGSVTVSALAGFLTAELRRVSENIEKANVALVLINQVRQSMEQYGDPFHHPGGENLRHQLSLSLYCERQQKAETLILSTKDDKNTLIGQKVKVVVKKSRFGPAPRTAYTTFLFAEGAGYDKIGIVNAESELIELAVEACIIKKGGAWYTLPDGEKYQGMEKVQKKLEENPDLLNEIKETLNKRQNIKITGNVVEVEELMYEGE